MNRKKLLTILISLILIAIILTIYVCTYKEIKNYRFWLSYKSEGYDTNGQLIDRIDNENYKLEITKDKLILCFIKTNKCNSFKYQKNENNYIIEETEEEYGYEIVETEDETYGTIIQFVQKYYNEPNGYSIMYFKKESKEKY